MLSGMVWLRRTHHPQIQARCIPWWLLPFNVSAQPDTSRLQPLEFGGHLNHNVGVEHGDVTGFGLPRINKNTQGKRLTRAMLITVSLRVCIKSRSCGVCTLVGVEGMEGLGAGMVVVMGWGVATVGVLAMVGTGVAKAGVWERGVDLEAGRAGRVGGAGGGEVTGMAVVAVTVTGCMSFSVQRCLWSRSKITVHN